MRGKYNNTKAVQPKPVGLGPRKLRFGAPVKPKLFDAAFRRLSSPPLEVVNASVADRYTYFQKESTEKAALLENGKRDAQQARGLYRGLSAGGEASAVKLVSLNHPRRDRGR